MRQVPEVMQTSVVQSCCTAAMNSIAIMSAVCLKSAAGLAAGSRSTAGIHVAGVGVSAFASSSQFKPELTSGTTMADAARGP